MKTTLETKHASTVWSFDIGLASLGEAIRDSSTHEFLHVESLRLHKDFADTKAAAVTRRMFRTRQAHQRREAWLDEVWQDAGLEPLAKRTTWRNPQSKRFELKHPGDPRLEREFPAQGDDTIYTSCLLRICLLRGDKLEHWQIYKALHSAIQRRGYDPNIPWKTAATKKADAAELKEAEEEEERLHAFMEELKAMTPNSSFHLPCYFEGWKMGLWSPENPSRILPRVDCMAESPRGRVAPRALVEKEITLLIQVAARLIPALQGRDKFLLYGPAETAYAAWYPNLRKQYALRLGSHTDTQGVLSQRLPRFDNRIISKCALIPRLNVCKITADSATSPAPQSRAVFDVIFLLKLKNMRVAQLDGTQRELSAEEIQAIFENPKRQTWSLTPKQWQRSIAPFGLLPIAGHEEVKAPKTSGRSRFCRPALAILQRLILSGDSPLIAYDKEVERLAGNKDPLKGLVSEDLEFLRKMGTSWENLYVPDQQLEAILQRSDTSEQAVREIIGQQNNPIVRHRLQVFYDRLQTHRQQFGNPETVVLEFVRNDFLGPKARQQYSKFTKDRSKERDEAAKEAAEMGLTGKGAPLKLTLFKEQGGVCLYTGEALDLSMLDAYEVDHIVPRSRQGPDAPYNRLLTTQATNKAKDNRTPFEWLSSTEGWEAYLERIKARATQLRNKRVRLLTSQDAENLVEKYTTLAETAWISRLARAVVDATFGWRNGVDTEGQKRVIFIQGGLTARIRRKYRLNSLLTPPPPGVDPSEWESKAEKNRKDHRHHALDAMVISFIPQWARNESKEHFFKFPTALGSNPRAIFDSVIRHVVPRQIAFEKAVLAETIYGVRKQGPQRTIVQRVPLVSLALKPTSPGKTTFDRSYLFKQIKTVRDAKIRAILEDIATGPLTEESWRKFCEDVRLPRKNGAFGPRILRVNVNVGEGDEYKDLSKDNTGAYRRGKHSHQGQILHTDASGLAGITPVYAHDSIAKLTTQLRNTPGITIHGFVQTGCLISLKSSVSKEDYKRVQTNELGKRQRIKSNDDLPPGSYIWRNIQTANCSVELEEPNGTKVALHLRAILGAGFSRV